LRLRDFYRGLASLLRAGLTVEDAVTSLRRNGTVPEKTARPIEAVVGRGETLSTALATLHDEVTAEDVALIEAGETTGRLAENLDRLADIHEARRGALRDVFTWCWYPLLLFHFAVLVIPISRLALQGRLTLFDWLGEVLAVLAPVYAIGYLVWRFRRSPRLREVADRVPGFGAALRHRRRALFASVLEAAYEAGVPLSRSVELAGRAVHEPRGIEAGPKIASGTPLAAALSTTGLLDAQSVAQVATAEQAGDIAAALRAIAAEERSLAEHGLKRASVGLAALVAIVVGGWIVVYVISFYLNYYGRLLG